MIGDVFLSWFNISSKSLAVEALLEDEGGATSTLLHPHERKIMRDIIRIINLMRELVRFAKYYGTKFSPGVNDVINPPVPLRKGLYLEAFANGMERLLDVYAADIANLEDEFLANPNQPLMSFSDKMMKYEPVGTFMRSLIRGMREQHLHGCGIIEYLHKKQIYGDQIICFAMKRLLKAVNLLFIKQLTHWMLYAQVIDPHGEFFIQSAEAQPSTNPAITEHGSAASKLTTAAPNPDSGNSYAAIWHYEIQPELLPYYFPMCWAEKVLFVGRTVLMFNKSCENWENLEINYIDGSVMLWNNRELEFLCKLHVLLDDKGLGIAKYERVVDEIKTHVAKRLTEITMKQANLEQQLHAVKDFYLLGRGELFLEFFRLIRTENQRRNDKYKMSWLIKTFESAMRNVGASKDLERFSLCTEKCVIDEADNSDLACLRLVELHYKMHWSLNMFFSPMAIDSYNILFRFLLVIKKIQYELQMVWATSKCMAKQNVRVLHLRNQLMLFIDNLEHYLKVDVLENQFRILLSTVDKKPEFVQIQKAHSIFLANVLSLCFLLPDDDATKLSQWSSNSSGAVYSLLSEIFSLCEEFFTLFQTQAAQVTNSNIEELDKRFNSQIEKVLNVLTDMKHQSRAPTPWAHLLLRLDLNGWFSAKLKREISD